MESLPKPHNQNIQWKQQGQNQPPSFLISPTVSSVICIQGTMKQE